MVSLKQLFEWFTTGKFPTEAQFAEQFKSFWHKSERIAMSYISGLVDALNGKASKEELANATTKFKGYHADIDKLKTAYPQSENKKDFFAWVGTPYPGTVWKVYADGGAWTDTGEVPTQEKINLTEYAKNTNANGDKVVYAPNGEIEIPEIDVSNEFGNDATKAIAQQVVSKRVEAIENIGFTSGGLAFPNDFTDITSVGDAANSFGNSDYYFETNFNKIVFYKGSAGNVLLKFITMSEDLKTATVVYQKTLTAVTGRNEIEASKLDFDFSASAGTKKYIVFKGVSYANGGGNNGSWYISDAGGTINRVNTNIRMKTWIYIPDPEVGETELEKTIKQYGSKIDSIENLEPAKYQDVIIPADYSALTPVGNSSVQNWGTWDFYFKNVIKQIIVYRAGAGNTKMSFVRISEDKKTYTVVWQKTFALVDGRNEIPLSDINYTPTGEKIYITFDVASYDSGASVNAFYTGDGSGNVTTSSIKLRLKAWIIDEEIVGNPSNLQTVISSHEQRLLMLEGGAGGNGSGVVAHQNLTWTSLGDSITWLNDNTSANVLYGYQTILKTKYQIKTHTNKAINGGGSGSLVGAMGSWTASDIFTILIGTNDWGYINTQLGTIADFKNNTANGTYYANMRRIIDRIYALNSKTIIFLMSPPFSNNSLDSSYVEKPNSIGLTLRQFVDACKEISEVANLPFVDVYSVINRNNVGNLTYDGLHPNTLGMQRMAHIIAPEFERRIESIY